MADPDKIHGIPGMMKSFDTNKGAPNLEQVVPNDPENTFRSVMEEGQAFVTRDTAATKYLTDFVQSVGFRFRADTNTARVHGHDYETADENGADKLQNIVFGNIYAPPLGKDPVI